VAQHAKNKVGGGIGAGAVEREGEVGNGRVCVCLVPGDILTSCLPPLTSWREIGTLCCLPQKRRIMGLFRRGIVLNCTSALALPPLREIGTELTGTILIRASGVPGKMGTLLLGSWWP